MDANDVEYHIGIDPGWKNLGVAVSEYNKETKKFKLLSSKVFNVSEYGTISKFIEGLDKFLVPLILRVDSVTIERYVAYAGVSTAESENICMVIGALSYYFASFMYWEKEPLLLRAIDWKTTLVKTLYKKKGFDNPSSKLDKKFSIAAAKACMDEATEFETDHEADAVCLSAYQKLTAKG